MGKRVTKANMRKLHRYLGFFLAGIMTVYSLSGIILIFRDTDLFKKYESLEKKVETYLSAEKLAKKLNVKHLEFKVPEADNENQGIQYIANSRYVEKGIYNPKTGEIKYVVKKTPYFLGKMLQLHKAKYSDPLYFLNIFFGLSLFFFVLSSFWMYTPTSDTFKKGMYFVIVGIILTLILLFV